MLDGYTCDRCKGRGERFFKTCSTCKGAGVLKTSPEARVKARQRAEKARRDGAQRENANRSVFLFAMRRDVGHPVLMRMRVDHEQGRQWTPAQIISARSIMQAEAQARKLLAVRPEFSPEGTST